MQVYEGEKGTPSRAGRGGKGRPTDKGKVRRGMDGA